MRLKDVDEESWVSLSNQLPLNSGVDLKKTKGNVLLTWVDPECGHSWERKLSAAISKNRCPYCEGRKVLPGFNDLATLFPEVASDWHPTKNNIYPSEVNKASHQKVWWLGKCGHEWEASIAHRTTNNRGCPVCANQKIIPGVNDLATRNPVLASQWHPTKNALSPTEISLGTPKKFWWQCEKGHEWETSPNKRSTSKRGCPICVNQKIIKDINDLAHTHPHLVLEWSSKNDISPTEVSYGSNKKIWWECEKGHEWETAVRERMKYGCPKCPTRSSAPEKDITSYLQSLGLYVENSVRTILPKQEVDIWVPAKNIAIEYNGLYWHSERVREDHNYHYDKWKACQDKGIQLIQVWEDEWKKNPNQVKVMLAHKLGVSVKKKIHGRKTKIVEISPEDANKFLTEHHIQGSVSGSIRLGLVEKEKPEIIVALMVLKKEAGTEGKILNLLRFATSANVQGGFTKIIKHIERSLSPSSIITFSDNCVSDGGLYKNNGFVQVKELAPDYMYIADGVREHKFNYRLKRFRNDLNLKYVDGLTEQELAKLNNLFRVWDAGKTKWELKFNI